MSTWAERAVANMVRLSHADNLAAAMREWHTTGGYEDSHSIELSCELCEHEQLRYQFEIENRLTHRILWVGSTCVTRFVPLFEHGREIVDETEKANFLSRQRAAHLADSRQQRAFTLLDRLAAQEKDVFGPAKWRTKWELGYSALELKMISAICKKHGLPFKSSDFKINTRRENIREQVRALEPWQYRRLRAALPKARQVEFDPYFFNR